MRWAGKEGSEPPLGPAWELPPGHLPWPRVEACQVLVSTELGDLLDCAFGKMKSQSKEKGGGAGGRLPESGAGGAEEGLGEWATQAPAAAAQASQPAFND